jgi:hypothetical protein
MAGTLMDKIAAAENLPILAAGVGIGGLAACLFMKRCVRRFGAGELPEKSGVGGATEKSSTRHANATLLAGSSFRTSALLTTWSIRNITMKQGRGLGRLCSPQHDKQWIGRLRCLRECPCCR